MDLSTFEDSLSQKKPPKEINNILLALWKVSKGEWDEAHNLVQDDPSSQAAWVHAYLHRIEGDAFNANYWYRRAGKPSPTSTDLHEEWKAIVSALLEL